MQNIPEGEEAEVDLLETCDYIVGHPLNIANYLIIDAPSHNWMFNIGNVNTIAGLANQL